MQKKISNIIIKILFNPQLVTNFYIAALNDAGSDTAMAAHGIIAARPQRFFHTGAGVA